MSIRDDLDEARATRESLRATGTRESLRATRPVPLAQLDKMKTMTGLSFAVPAAYHVVTDNATGRVALVPETEPLRRRNHGSPTDASPHGNLTPPPAGSAEKVEPFEGAARLPRTPSVVESTFAAYECCGGA